MQWPNVKWSESCLASTYVTRRETPVFDSRLEGMTQWRPSTSSNVDGLVTSLVLVTTGGLLERQDERKGSEKELEGGQRQAGDLIYGPTPRPHMV